MSLQFLEKIAEERFETEAERTAFKEAFIKEAALSDQVTGMFLEGMKDGARIPSQFSQGAGKALGALAIGVIGAALAKGALSTGSAVGNSLLHSKFENALSQVIATNRIVKNADPARVKGYAETIFKFAPHVASDPNILSSVLANVIHGDGVDPQTIKMLTDLEGRYQDNTSGGNIPRFS